jgi:dienelactone hydrolase
MHFSRRWRGRCTDPLTRESRALPVFDASFSIQTGVEPLFRHIPLLFSKANRCRGRGIGERREENSVQESHFESIAHLPYYQGAWRIPDLVSAAERAARHGDRFFEHSTGVRFALENGLSFASPYRSPHPENNTARALWYPCAASTRSAVILVPHWGTRPGDYKTLCRILNRVGISCLEMVTPYHGERAPKGCAGGEYAVSPDLLRTIATARQAVLEIRCAADWLQARGYQNIGLLGTSLGSCYAMLAAAHDDRFRVNVFNHCAGWLADVVWSGKLTENIRRALEPGLTLADLRALWKAISPSTYFHRLRHLGARSLLIYGRYDKTFRREHSIRTVEAFRTLRLDHKAVELRCGHQTLGWFPFNLIDAYQICNYLKENL